MNARNVNPIIYDEAEAAALAQEMKCSRWAEAEHASVMQESATAAMVGVEDEYATWVGLP